ncbi:MAG: hypothetical protein KDD50_12130 [Bdellovibrionales bacterium]|nr:hypothetical protein [Bdellovibrionales bacterium]
MFLRNVWLGGIASVLCVVVIISGSVWASGNSDLVEKIKSKAVSCEPNESGSPFSRFTMIASLLEDDQNYFRLTIDYKLADHPSEPHQINKILPTRLLMKYIEGREEVHIDEIIPGVDEDEGYKLTLSIQPKTKVKRNRVYVVLKDLPRKGFVRIQKILSYDKSSNPQFDTDTNKDKVTVECTLIEKGEV